MNNYLSADDILTLLFVEKGIEKEISEDEVIEFVSLLFKTRRKNKRTEVIEIDIPNNNNFDSEMFMYDNDKFNIVKPNQKRVLENYQNIMFDEELIIDTKQTFEELNNQEIEQKRIR